MTESLALTAALAVTTTPDATWDLVDAPSDSLTTAARIADLVAALNSTDRHVQLDAAASLCRYAYYNANRSLLRGGDHISSLLQALEKSDFPTELYVFGAIALMADDGNDDDAIDLDACRECVREPTAVDFTRWFDALSADSPAVDRLEAVELLGCMSSARPDRSEFRDFVPRLVFLLRSDTTALTAAAAVTIAQIALKDPEPFNDHGAVQLLLHILRDGAAPLKDKAANALAMVIDRNTATQTSAANAGAIDLLLPLLRDGEGEQRLAAAIALGMLVNSKNSSLQTAVVEAGAVAPLLELARNGRDEEKSGALFAILCLVDRHDANRAAFASAGLATALVDLLSTVSKDAAAAAITVFVFGNREYQAAVAQAGVFDSLVTMLRSGSRRYQDAAASAVGALVLEYDTNKVLAIDKGILEALVLLVRDGPTKATAANALAYFAVHDAFAKLRIVQAGALEPLVAMLRDGSDEEKAAAATALLHVAETNQSYAVEMALLGALEALVKNLDVSATTGSEAGVQAALAALCRLSEPTRNQDELLGLGIRRVLDNLGPVNDTIAGLVRTVRQNLRLTPANASANACRIM